MTLAQLIAFNAALLAALLSPGPAMLMSVRATLSDGRFTGIVTGLGLASMAALWTSMALLGLNVVFTLFPWAYAVARIAGGAYLMWLAFSIWRDAQTPLRDNATPVTGQRAFLSGFKVNLANPKSVLFAGSVLVMIFPEAMSITDKVLIIINHFVVEALAYTCFAVMMSGTRAKSAYLRLKPIFDRVTALVLGVLGLRIITDQSR